MTYSVMQTVGCSVVKWRRHSALADF